MMPRFSRPLLSLLMLASLAACGGNGDIKETLGLTHRAPDEFRVYARPPLTVPPEFNLRPPGSGAGLSAAVQAETQAHSAMLGAEGAGGSARSTSPIMQSLSSPRTGPAATAVPAVSSAELPSSADAQFLSNAGAEHADPQVRDKIAEESGKPHTVQDSSYLLGISKEGDPTVDATKEAQRLKDVKAQNKPVTTGDTPVIEPKSKGIWSDIF